MTDRETKERKKLLNTQARLVEAEDLLREAWDVSMGFSSDSSPLILSNKINDYFRRKK